jgi:serine protease Do
MRNAYPSAALRGLTLHRAISEVLDMSTQPLARRTAGVAVMILLSAACQPQSSTAASASAPGNAATAPAAPVQAPQQGAGGGGAAGGAAPAVAARALPDFAALVSQYGPAVVNVSVVGQARRGGGVPGISPDDPLYEFFRRFGMPVPRGGPRGDAPAPRARGEGSGFIVSSDGYILTNAHVVDEAGDVTVRMTDRREYTAKVIGLDKRTDVAVLKIDAKDLPTVRIGDPSRLRPGEWVIAIGSPFGFDNSVTAGIVSALARSIPGEDSNYTPFIQTDVAVNPGNSGGPLFNMAGEVVGINSQIYSNSGGYMGVSFAIPIDLANNVREQLVRTGKVTRGRIGVQIQEVNAQFAESFGLDRPRGALVTLVEGDGPADKGGVKAGDIIVGVNGRRVERSSELPVLITDIKPGTDAQLDVWRDRGIRKLTVRVGETPEASEQVAATGTDKNDADRLGLTVRELTPDERRGVETTGTLVVQGVEGPAAAANIRPGDIVLGVNGKAVKSVKELREATEKAGKSVALLIQRGDAQIFVPVRVG